MCQLVPSGLYYTRNVNAFSIHKSLKPGVAERWVCELICDKSAQQEPSNVLGKLWMLCTFVCLQIKYWP